jgi:hypothetical protein
VPLYTTEKKAPPPRTIVNLAAILAAALHRNIREFIPEFDERGLPAHEPYGEANMISVHTQGDMVSLCVLDLWNVFKDAGARYGDEFKARALASHGVCPDDDTRSYISGYAELCPEAGFQLAGADANDDERSDVTVTAAPTDQYFTSGTSLI